jgi:hypothetical protein
MRMILTFMILFGLTNLSIADTFKGKPKWTLDLRNLKDGTYTIDLKTDKNANPTYTIKNKPKKPIDKDSRD